MSKRFSFFLWGAIICQLLTGIFHCLSFVVEKAPANETEKQLDHLTTTYKMDAGAGFYPTFMDLFTSMSGSFVVLFILAGTINWFLKRRNIDAGTWRGLLMIESISFFAVFLLMLRFAFLPPVICTGLIFLFLLGALFSAGQKSPSSI